MEKLSPAMGSVSTQNTITSIEGILLETVDDGKIRLSTYDMNKGVRALVEPVSIERPGSFIVNAKRFYSTLRVLPDDDIVIDVNDKLNMTVSSGKSSFSMFAMPGQDFPKDGGAGVGTLSAGGFRRAGSGGSSIWEQLWKNGYAAV